MFDPRMTSTQGLSRQQRLLEEAARDRLAARAMTGQEREHPVLGSVLMRAGAALLTVGLRLNPRYAVAAAAALDTDSGHETRALRHAVAVDVRYALGPDCTDHWDPDSPCLADCA